MQKLKTYVGSALRPIMGYYDGYYELDMSLELDRVCLLHLLEHSQRVADARKSRYESVFGRAVVGDCSQRGNWSAFRNQVRREAELHAGGMFCVLIAFQQLFNDQEFLISPLVLTPFPKR
jgi:hypothetical protein